MKKVYLITDQYPYGVGEQFLESEVRYLARSVALTILPKRTGGDKRSLDKDVVVDNRLSVALSTAAIYLSPLMNIYFYKEIWRRKRTVVFLKDLKKLLFFISYGVRQFEILTRLVEQEGRDIVLYSYWSWETAFAFFLLKKHYPDVVMICRAHGFDVYSERHANNYMPFNKSYLNALNRVYCVSQHALRYMETDYDISKDILRVSRLGVDDPGMIAAYSNSKMHIISCSNVIKIKRIDRIVDALKELEVMTSLPIEWTHIGDGDLCDMMKEYANVALKRVKVNWLGRISNTEVKTYFSENKIDCFINTSDNEGVPVSIMEALSFGVPVVAFDVGGVAEVVNDKVGKCLDATSSSRELAMEIQRICSLNSFDYRRNIKAWWSRNYWARDNYMNFIEEVVSL